MARQIKDAGFIMNNSTCTYIPGNCKHTFWYKTIRFMFFKTTFGVCEKCGEFIQSGKVVSNLKWRFDWS
jgi:hypothetical protein